MVERNEIGSNHYEENKKSIEHFFKGFKLTKVIKQIGFSDTKGNNDVYDLTINDIDILVEIKNDIIDYVSTYGGYIYISKNDRIIKEIEL